jgi:heme A synthase
MRTGGLTLFPLLAALVSAQALLGVWTLVNAAPLGLSLLHQALGVIVLMSATRLVWASKRSDAYGFDRWFGPPVTAAVGAFAGR